MIILWVLGGDDQSAIGLATALIHGGLFEQYAPSGVYPLTWRPDFTGKGSPHKNIMWIIWRPGDKSARVHRLHWGKGLRGTRKAFIVGAAEPHQMHDMFVNKVMPEWRKLRDPAHFLNKDDDWPEIEIEQKTLITPGNAIESKERWKIAGSGRTSGAKAMSTLAASSGYWIIVSPGSIGAATACATGTYGGVIGFDHGAMA